MPNFFQSMIFCLFFGFGVESNLAQNCEGPTKDVSIIAVLDPNTPSDDSPRRFAFLIKNRSKAEVRSISIGATGPGVKSALDSFDVPEMIGSPEGWKAEHVVEEEPIRLIWYWSTEDRKYAIGPGDFVGGFNVKLDLLRRRMLGTYDDVEEKIIKPFNANGLPFIVEFFKGPCKWGRVITLKAE
jgi:hypothetical protein